MAKQRIVYLDLLKGICIILLVVYHIDWDIFGAHTNEMLQNFVVPMFFFLSGVFFKMYDSFNDFIRRKFNNLIIPFLFFLSIPLAIYYGAYLISTHFDVVKAWSMLPEEIVRLNTPIWFLLVLFEMNVVYYLLQKYLPRILTIIVVVLISIGGYIIVGKGWRLALYFDITMVTMPFFILGAEVRRAGWLEKGPHMALRLFLALAVIVLLYFFAQELNILERRYPNNYLLFMLLPGISILTLMFLCQYVKRSVPVICHMGRYSIIVLGTHFYLIKPARVVMQKLLHVPDGTLLNFFIILAVVLVLEYPVIYLLRRYVPRLVAQEPFFYDGWRLRKSAAD